MQAHNLVVIKFLMNLRTIESESLIRLFLSMDYDGIVSTNNGAANMNAKKIAKMFGCTEEQVKAQYARNAAQLAEMETKAKTAGRKVNGFTAQQLAEMCAKAENNAR